MKLTGLTPAEVEQSRREYGSNTLTQIAGEGIFKRLLKGFCDPMIIILLVALAVQVVLWLIGEGHWYEPVGILVAIIIANTVSSVSEHRQQAKANSLNSEQLARQTAKAMRDGALVELPISEIVCGDIVYLQAGDKLPADGEVICGELSVDQSALNGETDEAHKHPKAEPDAEYDNRDLLNKFYVYRGTVVVSGEGSVKIAAVGDKTLFGELALEVQENTRKTPLQVKLAALARQISVFGYIGAGAIILAVLGKTLLLGGIPTSPIGWVKLLLEAVTIAVTIIVCAVPEGLPMLTSILMSFQSLKMARDNVLVRKINGLETAGSLSLLYSDKTGTITEGKLSVVELATGNVEVFTNMQTMPGALQIDVVAGIGINNSASSSGGQIIGGNSTDRALMSFLAESQRANAITKEEVRAFDPFDSNKKTSSATINVDGRIITYLKGAPERILDRCTTYIDSSGKVSPLTERNYLSTYIDTQAGRSMRILAVAKCSGDDTESSELTLICVISIRDNVRPEAVSAIAEVQSAGVQVVMVTGDRKETASAIAKEAGLLRSNTDVVMTSAELSEKTDAELKQLLPRLRVVARALPTDKSRLVRIAQEENLVVGMTGDGVNDSPALKKADVGFAMGSGTEVAKEAGDITILDDNFSSIAKAILYGRTIFKTIRNFLIFQLTVNVSAVLISFIGVLFTDAPVLTVIQLLMVNLVMDTLAAVAFGTEPPLKEYMREKPVPRSQSVVTGTMLSQILLGGGYITLAAVLVLFSPFVGQLIGSADMEYLRACVFAVFMMAIAFGGFSARTSHISPFSGLRGNPTFSLIMLSVFLLQFLFVTFGGRVLSVHPLNPHTWLVCAVLAVIIIPVDSVRKLIMQGFRARV